MKLTIEIDIQPDEIGLATEMLQFLRSLSQQFGGQAPAVKNPTTLIRGVLSRLVDPANVDQVANDVHGILKNTYLGSSESLFDELVKAYLEVTFNSEHLYKGQTVVSFLRLIPKLEEPYKFVLRDKIISTVMQVLVVKRPVHARREDFFLYAEAFAGMVHLEYISLDGAATTIEKLLSNPDNRAAALTVLGKTTELCSTQLLESCDGVALDHLKKTVQSVQDDFFEFDLKYICHRMQWTHPLWSTNGKAAQESRVSQSSERALHGKAAATGTNLVPVTSWPGHKDHIYAMCYDPTTRTLVTGGKEGVCLVWNAEGKVQHRVPMPDHYLCALDIHTQRHLLFAAGVCSDNGKRLPPCIGVFSQEEKWQRKGFLSRPGNSLISCVKAVFDGKSDGFATGEEVGSSPHMEERVCYYDLGSATSVTGLQPEMHFAGHGDLVTCVTYTPLHPMMLFSGSRDEVIRIWDRRTGNSAGLLGTDTAGKVIAHENMVTWVDVSEADLVSSGGDGFIAHWDLRKMGNATTGCPPIHRYTVGSQKEMLLKVAIKGSPRPGLVAVADLHGLYLLDLKSANGAIYPAVAFPDGQGRRYFDLKWSDTDILYASSEKTVDVYKLQ